MLSLDLNTLTNLLVRSLGSGETNRSSVHSQLRYQSRKLVGALPPTLVEAHLFVRLAIGNGPVANERRVSCLAALILERQDHRHEGFLRRLPSVRVGIGENEPLVFFDFEIDTPVWHLLTVRAAHDDQVRASW